MPFQPEQGTNAMKRILIAGIVATLFAVPAFAQGTATPRAEAGKAKLPANEAKADGVVTKKDKASLNCASVNQGKKVAKPKQDKQKAPARAPATAAG
jgi:hypothetical protein